MTDHHISVVILAAGLGTRMKSKLAKVLHRVGGRTLAEHVVNTSSTITSHENIFVVVGHQAEDVTAVLQPLGVRFVQQHDQQGTGHALLTCRESLEHSGGLLVVLYGDAPLVTPATLQRLIDWQRKRQAAGTLITTHLEDPSTYGRVILDDQHNVRAIVEAKSATPQQLAIKAINSGIYCFNADLLWKHIGEIRPDNSAQEYYLTDIVAILNRHGHHVQAMDVKDSSELLGVNTRVDLAVLDRVIRDRKTHELMLSGVTIEKPETVTIDAQAEVGADTIVEPFTRILGGTVIGEDCRIGAGAILEDARIGNRVDVAPLTMIASTSIGDGARVGPYARLRPGNEIGPGAHVGNFVELKKTSLGPGSKANHLAYLGDAIIGERVNVGAGTITCNYDGVSKHETHIGDGVFVGSNATLVAPLEIGAESYLAAGSVITDRVPPGALALGRGRQVTKEGWVAKRKKKV